MITRADLLNLAALLPVSLSHSEKAKVVYDQLVPLLERHNLELPAEIDALAELLRSDWSRRFAPWRASLSAGMARGRLVHLILVKADQSLRHTGI